jgi:hypothetical protein
MYPNAVGQYLNTISKTKRGLRVLIADDLPIERLIFLDIIKHYLPDSVAQAVDRSGLEDQLKAVSDYDLVILEANFLICEPDGRCIRQVRHKYPNARTALFTDRENLYRLQSTVVLSKLDIILTKCATVEAIAEKLCLAFQQTQ